MASRRRRPLSTSPSHHSPTGLSISTAGIPPPGYPPPGYSQQPGYPPPGYSQQPGYHRRVPQQAYPPQSGPGIRLPSTQCHHPLRRPQRLSPSGTATRWPRPSDAPPPPTGYPPTGLPPGWPRPPHSATPPPPSLSSPPPPNRSLLDGRANRPRRAMSKRLTLRSCFASRPVDPLNHRRRTRPGPNRCLLRRAPRPSRRTRAIKRPRSFPTPVRTAPARSADPLGGVLSAIGRGFVWVFGIRPLVAAPSPRADFPRRHSALGSGVGSSRCARARARRLRGSAPRSQEVAHSLTPDQQEI